MFTKTKTATALIVGLLITVVAGCSTDEKAEKKPLAREIIDSLVVAVVDNLEAPIPVSAKIEEAQTPTLFDEPTGFRDMVLLNGVVYGVHEEGVVVVKLSDRSKYEIRCEQELSAITVHQGTIYVGGELLYELVDSSLQLIDLGLTGSVTDLYSYGQHLLIGTSNGLYSNSIFGFELLLEDAPVTAMIADGNGVWVGTDGYGLYRWNGDQFKQRFLRRDTTIFDYVNALGYGHDHLYVSTNEAMYIYDGGSWKTYTSDEGLPETSIRSIDATGWVVYLSTNDGLVSFYNEEFTDVKKLEDVSCNKSVRFGRRLIVASDEGILMKSGPAVSTLADREGTSEQPSVAVTLH